MALHFDYALRLRSNSVKTPGLYGYAGVVVHRSASLASMYSFADKTPGVDTGWDAIHTFIRIPAGAMLAAGAVGDLNPAVELAAALLGGELAAGTHATKAGTRVLINTSPEPFSNWTASVAEDAAVIGGVWSSIHYPSVFLAFLIVFVILMICFFAADLGQYQKNIPENSRLVSQDRGANRFKFTSMTIPY